jgi:hypothetical protein
VAHTGPLVLLESFETPGDVVVDHYLHAGINPHSDVNIGYGPIRVTFPELMSEHWASDLGVTLEGGYVVVDDTDLPTGSITGPVAIEDGRHP